MADATTRVSTTNERAPEVMMEIVMKAAKKFMANKGDPTEMEGALKTVQKIITDGDKALISVKELCIAREEAIEAREKSIESKKRVIKAMKKVLGDKKKAIEEKDKASDVKEHATAVREKAIEAREKAVEAKEKNLGIMAPTATMGKKRDFTVMSEASEEAGRKKARVDTSNGEIQAKEASATREPNNDPGVTREILYPATLEKFDMLWYQESEKLRKAEVGILARAKKLVLDEFTLLSGGKPRPSDRSTVASGIMKLHEHKEFRGYIAAELMRYLHTLM
ncbi:hypothetical protein J3E69DRAFT_225639 [Trichoderma sp. SZMC 28015]